MSKITVLVKKIKVANQRLFLLFFTTKRNGRFYKKNQSSVDFVKKTTNLKQVIRQKNTKSIEIRKKFEKLIDAFVQ